MPELRTVPGKTSQTPPGAGRGAALRSDSPLASQKPNDRSASEPAVQSANDTASRVAVGLAAALFLGVAAGVGLWIGLAPEAPSTPDLSGPPERSVPRAATGGRDVQAPIARPTHEAERAAPPSEAVQTGAATDECSVGSSGKPLAEELAETLARLEALSPKERERELMRLAWRADAPALAVFERLAGEERWLFAVLTALGRVRREEARPAAARILRGRLRGPRPDVRSAAIAAYAKVMGAEAAAELRALLREEEYRAESGSEVTAAVAAALGRIGTPEALAALAEELKRAGNLDWSLEYGSVLVAALAPHREEKAVAAALEGYARTLSEQMPGAEHGPGRAYYQEKLDEVRAALVRPEDKRR